MAGTIKITLGEVTNSATSRTLRFFSQVKQNLRAMLLISETIGWCQRTLDIEDEQVTVELRTKQGKTVGRLSWKKYSQEEPIEISKDLDGDSLSQAALQIVDSYYEVIDKTPPRAIIMARKNR